MLMFHLDISRSIAKEIILSTVAANKIYHDDEAQIDALKWYSDQNKNFVGLYYDHEGQKMPPPTDAAYVVEMYPVHLEASNWVTGEATNLLYMYQTVTTALVQGTYTPKGFNMPKITLVAGQQVVIWYIPASIIPMRTVSELYDPENPSQLNKLGIKEVFPICTSYAVGLADDFDVVWLTDEYKSQNRTPDGEGYYFYTNDWPIPDGNFDNRSVAVFNPNSHNPYYYFVEDTPVYTFDGLDYTLAENFYPDTDYYVVNEYFDEKVPGYIAQIYTLVNQTITNIVVDSSKKPYVPAGERKEISVTTTMKTDNLTQTSDFKMDTNHYDGLQVYQLGNNGRIEVEDDDPEITLPSEESDTDNREQAITDLITSVALQETALAHILNAEGEKIQAFIRMADVTSEQILALNRSVNQMLNAVTRLEMVLQAKLELFV
jgi:hypothetical protein